MAGQWFYRMFGQDFGPIPLNELQELIQTGSVTESDEVRAESSTAWVLAGSVRELGFAAAAVETSATAVTHPPNSVGSDDWYYKVGLQEVGPVGFQEIVSLAEQGRLAADDEVKLGANGKWRRVGSIGRLVSALPFQQPLPKSAEATTPEKLAVSVPAPVSTPIEAKKTVTETPPQTNETKTAPPLPSQSTVSSPAAVGVPATPPSSGGLARPAPIPPRPVFRPAYSSDRSLGATLKWPLGIALAVIVLAAVGWMFWPNPAAADIERYKTLKQVLDDIRAAREAKATDFDAIKKRILKLNQVYVAPLKAAASHRRAAQKLLEAARDHLPKLYFVDLSRETGYEKDYEASLKEAAKLLGIK